MEVGQRIECCELNFKKKKKKKLHFWNNCISDYATFDKCTIKILNKITTKVH